MEHRCASLTESGDAGQGGSKLESDTLKFLNFFELMNNSINRSRPIKRIRRTKADMEQLKAGLYDILTEYNPQTVRGVFYQAVGKGLVEKTEKEYKNAVQRNLAIMRLSGEIPFEWIIDNSRWMRKPPSYSGIRQALEEAGKYYRRAIWQEQSDYIEFWMEKDTLAGIVYPITEKWDVPLMVTHGYSSLTFLYESADHINYVDKCTYIYALTDYDPSGENISINIEKRLREFAPDIEIHFKKIAVTSEQISEWNLPTRPPKKKDKRAKGFGSECVELDTIPPWKLQELVEKHLRHHIRNEDLEGILMAEQAERETLNKFLTNINL